jgi:hypothetical protein
MLSNNGSEKERKKIKNRSQISLLSIILSLTYKTSEHKCTIEIEIACINDESACENGTWRMKDDDSCP